MQHADNPTLCTLIYLHTVKYEIMGFAAKYGLNGAQCGVSTIKRVSMVVF